MISSKMLIRGRIHRFEMANNQNNQYSSGLCEALVILLGHQCQIRHWLQIILKSIKELYQAHTRTAKVLV